MTSVSTPHIRPTPLINVEERTSVNVRLAVWELGLDPSSPCRTERLSSPRVSPVNAVRRRKQYLLAPEGGLNRDNVAAAFDKDADADAAEALLSIQDWENPSDSDATVSDGESDHRDSAPSFGPESASFERARYAAPSPSPSVAPSSASSSSAVLPRRSHRRSATGELDHVVRLSHFSMHVDHCPPRSDYPSWCDRGLSSPGLLSSPTLNCTAFVLLPY